MYTQVVQFTLYLFVNQSEEKRKDAEDWQCKKKLEKNKKGKEKNVKCWKRHIQI